MKHSQQNYPLFIFPISSLLRLLTSQATMRLSKFGFFSFVVADAVAVDMRGSEENIGPTSFNAAQSPVSNCLNSNSDRISAMSQGKSTTTKLCWIREKQCVSPTTVLCSVERAAEFSCRLEVQTDGTTLSTFYSNSFQLRKAMLDTRNLGGISQFLMSTYQK